MCKSVCVKTAVQKDFCAYRLLGGKKMCVKIALGKVSACESFGVYFFCAVCVDIFFSGSKFSSVKVSLCKNCSVQKFLCIKGSVCKSACVPLLCVQKHLCAKHRCVKTFV